MSVGVQTPSIPGGDRQAHHALHTIALVRMSHHQPTIAYVARQLAKERSGKETLRG